MSNSKNIIIIALVIVLIALGGWTYYTLTVSVPEEAETECMAKIDNEVIPQVQAVAEEECAKAIQTCQGALEQIMLIPVCASALTQ